MARKQINVGLIGQAFMGKAHSNAWTQVMRFFDPPAEAVMHTVAATNEETLPEFAERFGWQNWVIGYEKLLEIDEIDLIDVGSPSNLHRKMAVDAMEAGKAVACEKPMAGSFSDAKEMLKAAKQYKVPTYVWYSYRRCPAVSFAYQLVKDGALGQLRHVRGYYLQDWAMDPNIPLAWRFRKDVAGSGSHGDLGAHVIDMVRFVTGEEITEIDGAIQETFIKERPLMSGSASGGLSQGFQSSGEKGDVAVDDATLFLARMEGGAVAQFEATRFATGSQNLNGFEINGSKGAVRFNFERMNELEYYDATGPRATQGWRTIICTHGGDHPYADAWWPDAHVIGYEHAFTNMAYDILRSLAGEDPIIPLPDFEDAFQVQRVLEAVEIAAREKRHVELSEVR
ncbi:MAG: Gfo/Idh/MocA family protein [Phycisphaerae bacterium]